MRKVRDYYFKKAKAERYPARSVYKLQEAQQRHRFLKRGQRVLDLGCHPGSWSLYAARAVGPSGVVVGVDLQETRLRREKGAGEIHCLCYDIFSDELIETLTRTWPGFHVLLSDMAPRTTGNRFADHQRSLRLVERVLDVAPGLLHDRGSLFVKVFQGEDFPDLLATVRAMFDRVKVVKPAGSRRESAEVFVLGRGFRNPGR